ncbi:AMP-binding enzyme family protein [Mycobacterium xenopi 4042]|uniref:AMP-binding enzyme family protein n=1 Tax=Mycobacterium xenopi 4042 TaxID=1299334 RepID=X8E4R9_MYCXE|nr:AMP-binding enzyme family protein [Mycobacterium xenopi 4042]
MAVPQPQTILVPGPMYHTNGFAPLNNLLGGDRLVVLEKFDAATVVDSIERYRVTNFTATPTMLARIAALPDIRRRDFSSVAWILQGAAVMPPALLHTWFELLSPERILMAYGMTENLGSPRCAATSGWRIRAAWAADSGAPRSASSTNGANSLARTARRGLSARADERRVPLSGRRTALPSTRTDFVLPGISAIWTQTAISTSPTVAPT